jgi:hypothetical protein
VRRLSAVALSGLAALGLMLGGACGRKATSLGYYTVPGASLEVPRTAGWSRDESAVSGTPDKGGIVFRLVRTQAVTGSPRIDVVLEPRSSSSTLIEDFLERNLRDMNALERSGGIHIEGIDERPVQVGPRRGYHVRHEYVVASSEIAITQVSVFLVLDGRGVAITAAGRTELFVPLVSEVDAVLNGIRTAIPNASSGPVIPDVLKPIDLGKVGGGRR